MIRLRGWDAVLGMNRRNARIARENPAEAIRLVNNKYATKQALTAAGAPTSPTLGLLRSRREIATLDWDGLPDCWALKPNQGLGGSGIMLSFGRGRGGWRSSSGRPVTRDMVVEQLRRILDGEYSPRPSDWALFEPLIRAHPDLARLSHQGLPDIRVICVGDEPRLAMLRLPTRFSGGRANLHQRAIGAAVDLDTGRITHALVGKEPTENHPDTAERLIGAAVPYWPHVLDAARRCAAATGLRYLGADIVVDAERGPLILEVNARPGLQIQNVTGHGLMAAGTGTGRR
ncbi:alpha-L-glutamate ligase-like protein [Longispora fulva]|uniref:Alpha-L-glutamate ligase-like protein n=1 Tax=Longispora fulva TaxID=619741 RepID=A0A8J7GMK6_9ACTN|nr:sugar-transfer associated ATP-grasp domain-containing protein [Longispora fulva]MBG6134383.1 alpha-L-glutamate ligase-like protein [Longispora fulva]GIG62701.1 alpha-L-glutamate ligase-like protein [Longispora fulva]